jgi:uncharacterized phage protein (TIGR01671 family)
MREIKFRGKLEFSSGWIVGGYCQWRDIRDNAKHQIISNVGFHNDVKPETVGQFTGLKDKNGVEIYEDDFCKYHHNTSKWLVSYSFKVIFENGAYYAYWERIMCGTLEKHKDLLSKMDLSKVKVIGNIYENPELL